jgi:hypothetical protein
VFHIDRVMERFDEGVVKRSNLLAAFYHPLLGLVDGHQRDRCIRTGEEGGVVCRAF